MKQSVAIFCAIAFSAVFTSAFATDSDAPQDSTVKPMAVEASKMRSGDITPMKTQCYTNDPACAGVAHFQNDDASRYVGCSVYFNNGTSGQSNFVLPPKQSHDLHVRYSDTYACVYGNNAPPNNAQRYYIWVR